ncbi:MAG: glycosyltransferase family 2 protein, partial [Bacteroidota bacterium]
MISVCIPVYRYDVRLLVRELLRQAEEFAEVHPEVLVYDDASPEDPAWGKAELRRTPGIRYVELPTNSGRAAIRNKMATEARHDYVLLLDADGEPGPDFLNDYFLALEGDVDILVGGREYAREAPPSPYRLHWYYGLMR